MTGTGWADARVEDTTKAVKMCDFKPGIRYQAHALTVTGVVRLALLVGMSALGLAGCGWMTPSVDQVAREQQSLTAFTRQWLSTPDAVSDWSVLNLPGKRIAAFEPAVAASTPALRVQADASVSILRQRFALPLMNARYLSIQWRVDGLPNEAELAQADRSDSPVGVLLAFDGNLANWTPRDHRVSELSRLLTGEALPHATLAYVWSESDRVGDVVPNPRTGRIRKWVLDSGTEHLGQWRLHERDIRADFRQAFGEEPGPLLAVALMTDTDNTQSRLTAWYGPLRLVAGDDKR